MTGKKRPEIPEIPVHCAHDGIVDISTLRPNPRNPNRHPDTQIDLYAKAIAGNGWRRPITISNLSGMITRGHGALLAARKLGLKTAPVDYQDYASEALEMADIVADNRLAELAELSLTGVKDILLELNTGDFDMDLTGFDAGEMERLMTSFTTPDFLPTSADEQPRLDEKAKVTCPNCGHEF
jgi:ParB-like chromosome segregation protein Spo0J